MREIKFRGIPTYGKDFVYGSLIININEAGRKEYLIKKHIGIIEVIPETVGQYTGLKDKNGIDIYEGDYMLDSHSGSWGEVKFIKGAFIVEFDNEIQDLYDWTCESIIGNIYENKELLNENK